MIACFYRTAVCFLPCGDFLMYAAGLVRSEIFNVRISSYLTENLFLARGDFLVCGIFSARAGLVRGFFVCER